MTLHGLDDVRRTAVLQEDDAVCDRTQALVVGDDDRTAALLLGERPEQTGAVAGRGSHLAAHNLALVLEGTDRAAEAAALRAAHPWPR